MKLAALASCRHGNMREKLKGRWLRLMSIPIIWTGRMARFCFLKDHRKPVSQDSQDGFSTRPHRSRQSVSIWTPITSFPCNHQLWVFLSFPGLSIHCILFFVSTTAFLCPCTWLLSPTLFACLLYTCTHATPPSCFPCLLLILSVSQGEPVEADLLACKFPFSPVLPTCHFLCMLPASWWFVAWLTVWLWSWRWYISQKHLSNFTRLHSGLSQKTA
jgi:hypothetical protein